MTTTTADLRNVVSFYADTVYDAAYLATNSTRLDNICRRVANGSSLPEFDELLNRVVIELCAVDRARFAAESLDAAIMYETTTYDSDYVTNNADRMRRACEQIVFGTTDRTSTLEELRNRLMIHLRSN